MAIEHGNVDIVHILVNVGATLLTPGPNVSRYALTTFLALDFRL
jgi:hypothetical protein